MGHEVVAAAANVSSSAEPSRYAVPASDIIAVADDFIASLGVNRRCALFTVVPSNHSVSAVTREVAKAVGVPVVMPTVDGLRTYDYSHLEEESAERWSAAFLELAEPLI